jgi:hypothetical protein
VAVLVCGIVRSAPAELSQPLAMRLVRSASLAAVVRDIADDAVLGDDDAEHYFESLVALLSHGPVLPVRFGTVAPDDDAVRSELLDAASSELAARLEMLDGLVEVRIHVELDPAEEARRLGSSSTRGRWRTRAGSASLEDRIELGQEISEALGEQRDQLGDRLVEHLGDLAVAHAHLRSEEVTELRHAYLVRADELFAFDAKVEALRAGLPPTYTIEYVGPLPPFDFTDLDIELRERAKSRWGW